MKPIPIHANHQNDEYVLAEAINEGYLHIDAQLQGSRRLNLATQLDVSRVRDLIVSKSDPDKTPSVQNSLTIAQDPPA